MSDIQPSTMRGPRFDPEEAARAAVAQADRAADTDTDTDWRRHVIPEHPAEDEALQGSPRFVPLPGDTQPPSPFQGFLLDLKTAMEDDDAGGDGRTELELSLHYLDRSSGQEKACLCSKLRLSPDDCLRQGMPDLESLALDYAVTKGPWGAYRWNIRGWVRGALSCSTSQRINLMEPPGWAPKESPKPQATPAAPDPFDQLRGTLDLVRTMREATGMDGGRGGADPATLQAATMAAEMRARFEMGEAHRRELDGLREAHRKEVDKLRDQVEELKRALQEKDFELRTASQVGAEPPGPLQTFIGNLDKGAVNGLLAAVAGKLMEGPKPAPAKVPARTRPELRPAPSTARPSNPAPLRPNPATAPQAIAEPSEPSRLEAFEAVALLEDASDIDLNDAEDVEVRKHLATMATAGLKEGSLAPWWALINGPVDPCRPETPTWLQYAEFRIAQAEAEADPETDPQEEPMDFEALKARLIAQLDAGATDEAILAELETTLTPIQRGELANMVGMVPSAMLGGIMGAPRHQARLVELRQKLRA